MKYLSISDVINQSNDFSINPSQFLSKYYRDLALKHFPTAQTNFVENDLIVFGVLFTIFSELEYTPQELSLALDKLPSATLEVLKKSLPQFSKLDYEDIRNAFTNSKNITSALNNFAAYRILLEAHLFNPFSANLSRSSSVEL